MLRSIWKGHIRFSLVTIPIRIYSATRAAPLPSINALAAIMVYFTIAALLIVVGALPWTSCSPLPSP